MATDHDLHLRERLARLRNLNLLGGAKLSGELEKLQRQLDRIQTAPTDEEIWRSVELARHPDRPYTLDYAERLLDDFVELHGDRGRGDDQSVVTGLAATTPRSSPESGASTAGRWRSSGTRRGATSRNGPIGTSGWPTRRAIGRRCV